LQAAIQKAASIEPVNMNLSFEEMAAMVEYVEASGDPINGEAIYRRDNLLCITCHAIGGSGGTLGPDFTSIGASAPVDYLIDSILLPQKQIKEGYHVVMITKKDGTVAAGKLASENDIIVTVQDAADQLIEIPKSTIASQEMSPISLMPPGLTQSLRKDEFADLIKFMSRLGKEGDFKVGYERYIRTFRSLDDKGGDKGYADMVRHKPMEFLTTDDPRLIWRPSYSKTNGDIPLEDLPQVRGQGWEHLHFIRFQLNAKTPGNSILQFNDAEGVHVFVGGDKVEMVSDDTPINLKPGLNQVTVAVPVISRSNQILRIEVLDAPSGSAQVQVIYGK
jgi:putative heme-binding domain-containing protein